jgi:hypothetical protein
MNERIGELAEQAFNEANNGSINNIKIPKEFVEKFAELIVQECAALAKSKSEHIQSMETDARGDQAQIHALAWQFEEFGYEIKKHFEVGE